MRIKARLLVVEDEDSMREFLEILLRRHQYHVTSAAGGQAGLTQLEEREFDLVITDLRMPSVDGLQILEATRARYPQTEVVMITAFATTDTAISAMKRGAYDYLTKPFKVDEILVTVERALEKRELVRSNVKLREQLSGRSRLENLIGRSPAMQQVFEMIRKVATTATNVLVLGESGTGSELFGHVRGAFTGATADKLGLFSVANEGTVFLDEIAELPQTMQVKLLRTLQERTIKPVGSVDERKIDVRVIAATNRNLDEEVRAGRFRTDLFYRLNVIPVPLPALRDRRQDIPLLVEHFIDKYATRLGKPHPVVNEDAIDCLRRYHYPGNVRELENMVERAVALFGETLGPTAFPQASRPPSTEIETVDALPENGLDLDEHMGAVERALLRQALDRSGGNRTEAARILGISMRSMRYRLSKYGMGDPS